MTNSFFYLTLQKNEYDYVCINACSQSTLNLKGKQLITGLKYKQAVYLKCVVYYTINIPVCAARIE